MYINNTLFFFFVNIFLPLNHFISYNDCKNDDYYNNDLVNEKSMNMEKSTNMDLVEEEVKKSMNMGKNMDIQEMDVVGIEWVVA